MATHYRYEAIVMGTSAGGLRALGTIVRGIPGDFRLPIVIVQHLNTELDVTIATLLGNKSALRIKEAEDKEPIRGGTAYVAPPNYHLLVEAD